MRRAAVILALLFCLAPVASLQTAKPATSTEKLPPISFTCPMHPDVVDDKEGKCPICAMALEPVRIDSIWTCQNRPVVHQYQPGKCPIDGSNLVQMIVAVTFRCPDAGTTSLNPGTCPDGSTSIWTGTPRPHGNHNPQHGGQFFMAPDNWHHLEGTFLPTGVFRLYLYDDYTKPLALDLVKEVKARLTVATSTAGAPAGTPIKENTSLPLVRKNRYLEVPVGKLGFPAHISARVSFLQGTPEHLFDFTFESFSKKPTDGAPTTTGVMPGTGSTTAPSPTTSAGASTNASTPAAGSGATSGAGSTTAGGTAMPSAASEGGSIVTSGLDPALITVPIPDTVPEMLSQLRVRDEQIKAFIDRGAFANVYVPAFQAKDLALALDEHKKDLPFERQALADLAISRLVRFAYILDAYGDLGNRQQILEAYARFATAVKDIESTFPQAAGRPPK
jgi:hypothetical protein